MKMRPLFLTAFIGIMGGLGLLANAQLTDQAGRELARNIVRSQLHLNPTQFLEVQREEDLELSLASIVARPSWALFIYKVSQEGDEIKEGVVIHHGFSDIDPTHIIAINPADGSSYGIRGFADSLVKLDDLMKATKVDISTPQQAEAVADFFQEVNPSRDSIAPVTSLIRLKQAAEIQCQTGSFDADEMAFDIWWRHATPLYARLSFNQNAIPHGSGYVVEWIVLSSAAPGLCGGAPLRATLSVEKDGEIGKLTFAPLR